MKAIIAQYKSEAKQFCKEKNVPLDEVKVICTKADLDGLGSDYEEVIVVSAPVEYGFPSADELLRLLQKKVAPKQVKPQDDPPMIGGDHPSNEAEVAEIKPAAKKPAAKKAAPKKKATPKAKK